MTQAAIRKLIDDGIVVALETQAAAMANTDNTNRNTETNGTPVARKGTNDHKRKFDDRRNTTSNNNYRNNYQNNHSNCTNDYRQQQNRRP